MHMWADKQRDLALTVMSDHLGERVAVNAYLSEFAYRFKGARSALYMSGKERKRLKSPPTWEGIWGMVRGGMPTPEPLASRYYWEFADFLARLGDHWTLTSEDIAVWIACAGYSGHPFAKTVLERRCRRCQIGSF